MQASVCMKHPEWPGAAIKNAFVSHHKRQRRVHPLRYHSHLPTQNRADPSVRIQQCAASDNGSLPSGPTHSSRCFSPKARRGSSHGVPALPCIHRQLSEALHPGTCSRHSRIFHCPAVYAFARRKSSKTGLPMFHLNGMGKQRVSLCM